MNIQKLGGLALLLALSACGGGGGSTTSASPSAAALAQICAPSNENTFRADAAEPTRTGSFSDEKKWVKAYLNENYLWYRDMPVIDASLSKYSVGYYGPVLTAYFRDLLTPKKTAKNQPVDKFSFITTTADWNSYAGGTDLNYGWILSERGTGASRRVFVAYVYPNTVAQSAGASGVLRGDEIISIDGVAANAVASLSVSAFNAALYPSASASHNFVLARGSSSLNKTLSAASTALPQAESKVVQDSQGVRWGYLLFNEHVQGVETQLVQAISNFKTQNVNELVIDLRYNSGGYLSIANALAYAIAGPARAAGKVFERIQFNDKRSNENTEQLFSPRTLFGNQSYTPLNFSKIYVLTSKKTCSASESLINGLRGIDVTVEIIGDTTCGKPYGFYPKDNCGITYAAMEFEGVNAKGEGRYSDGLAPSCVVADDLSHPWGDPAEAMFAQAIARRNGQNLSCVPPIAAGAPQSSGIAVKAPTAAGLGLGSL